MRLNKLIANVKDSIKKKINIKKSISILNIPKQKILDRGDLIILLDDENNVLFLEWSKPKHYHIEIKGNFDNSIISEIFENEKLELLETLNFDGIFDSDYCIDYKLLKRETKKKLKQFIHSAEKIFEFKFSMFSNKINKRSWFNNIKIQNEAFIDWCHEQNCEDLYICIKEAFRISNETENYNLKRKASLAKCFDKITKRREKLQ